MSGYIGQRARKKRRNIRIFIFFLLIILFFLLIYSNIETEEREDLINIEQTFETSLSTAEDNFKKKLLEKDQKINFRDNLIQSLKTQINQLEIENKKLTNSIDILIEEKESKDNLNTNKNEKIKVLENKNKNLEDKINNLKETNQKYEDLLIENKSLFKKIKDSEAQNNSIKLENNLLSDKIKKLNLINKNNEKLILELKDRTHH